MKAPLRNLLTSAELVERDEFIYDPTQPLANMAEHVGQLGYVLRRVWNPMRKIGNITVVWTTQPVAGRRHDFTFGDFAAKLNFRLISRHVRNEASSQEYIERLTEEEINKLRGLVLDNLPFGSELRAPKRLLDRRGGARGQRND